MKRSTLLLFAGFFALAVAVGFESPIENKEASVSYSMTVDNGSDADYLTVVNYSVNVDADETGESIAVYAPEAIWVDVIHPVDVNPPINADVKLSKEQSPSFSNALRTAKRWQNSYSDRAKV